MRAAWAARPPTWNSSATPWVPPPCGDGREGVPFKSAQGGGTYFFAAGGELLFGVARALGPGLTFATAPRDAGNGAGTSRKAGTGDEATVRRGHSFYPQIGVCARGLVSGRRLLSGFALVAWQRTGFWDCWVVPRRVSVG